MAWRRRRGSTELFQGLMMRDLRLAARMMLQSRGWTSVVLVSLALGIGANTALFSAMNGLLFRKVPVADPDRLVRLRSVGRNQMRTDTLVYGFSAQDAHGRRVDPTFSYPMYRSSSTTTARCPISSPLPRSATSISWSTARPTSRRPSWRPATTITHSASRLARDAPSCRTTTRRQPSPSA